MRSGSLENQTSREEEVSLPDRRASLGSFMNAFAGFPPKFGLYDPENEHDACGVGFVAHLRGEKSHQIIEHGIEILENLHHRGATGSDSDTGDGAGILMQTPDAFFRKEAAALGISLPKLGGYAGSMVFLAPGESERSRQIQTFERVVREHGQEFLGWRDVPHDPQYLGRIAREGLPHIRQAFVGASKGLSQDAFERTLYVIRRCVENTIRQTGGEGGRYFYVTTLSSRTVAYKGMMLAHQLRLFFPDLTDSSMLSALALVHQRYATNTFPTWSLAHPFRYLAHNGEINTRKGNVNWMHAREGTMRSNLFGEDLKKLYPVTVPGMSDSAQFDNALEFLHLTGRDLHHAILMMIPEAWEGQDAMAPDRRAFYEYHNCLMEPWDGPASIAFTDGRRIGAVLDRNGLRPSRYVVTKDGFVIMASEVGVLDVPPANVAAKGRLQPGRMFLVDMQQGRIVKDEEVKAELVARQPYRKWVEDNLVRLHQLPAPATPTHPFGDRNVFELQQTFGYTTEDIKLLMAPMVATGREALGSMGDDTRLAVLSKRPRLLYHYFKQMFAQVTNPAIDSTRERSVMSVKMTLGGEKNILEETPEHARLIELERPVLTDEELDRLRHVSLPGFEARTLSITYKPHDGARGLEAALERLCENALRAVDEGANVLILTDRDVSPDLAPIPALLATSAVHHHLIRNEARTKCGIVVESGAAREVNHFALLIGYGAGAVCPYLAFETVETMIQQGTYVPVDMSLEQAVENYRSAIDKGLLKIIAKMGISTLRSYMGAQIFEAVGLAEDFVEKYFTGTPSRIGGIGIEQIAREVEMRHHRAFPGDGYIYPELDPGGLYQWRRRGESHTFNPETVAKLQHAVRQKDYKKFKEYSAAANADAETACTLRGLLRFVKTQDSVPLEEVESVTAIAKRFCTGAMSYGSISKEAHETLAIAMNRIGGKSNTGEGGEDPERFTPLPNGDSKRSAIKQVASGRFGVTSWYLVNADELQIKVAQGAKPGEGGQLPGYKVNEIIAKMRHSTPGVGLISPPPHHDIYSIEDLAQLIHDLKNANPRAKISVKLVAEVGVGTVAAGVAKGKADGVLISGHDGGTGASPLTSIKYAGIPWELGLSETQQTLVANDLRGRIRVQVDGGLKTGRDVVIGALLGADEFGFATTALVSMGCTLMRVCHLNTCPVGVATQDPELRRRFQGKPEHVINFFFFVAEEVRELMAHLGYRRMDDLIGHTEHLAMAQDIRNWKARGIDLSKLLVKPDVSHATYYCEKQDHGLENALDHELIEKARPALEERKLVSFSMPIRNVNRTVGTILGSEVSRRFGAEGLPEDTIRIDFSGSAGQSFGAFVPRGITLTIEGDANDYIGKGLSGGKLAVRVSAEATFDPTENVIIGNVALYGATSGEAYFNGLGGERFCVRNSGALAVVEGVGDHGCEYMTGGRVVVLGKTGRNFAAGMSGGIAYVLDLDGDFRSHCNTGSIDFEELDTDDLEVVQQLVRNHVQYTASVRAAQILEQWDSFAPKFVKVMPVEYKRALAELARKGASHG